MSLIKAIKERSSCAIMTDEDVPRDIITEILDAAVCTPVHHRTDPWRFLVIHGAGRERLGDVMADHVAKGMMRKGEDLESPKSIKFLNKIKRKPLRAPVTIVVGAAKSDKDQAMMVEDVASASVACQNILLAAWDLGLSAIWRTGGVTYAETTAELLGFDGDTELVGFIYLGYPKKDIPSKTRKTSTDFTRWLEN